MLVLLATWAPVWALGATRSGHREVSAIVDIAGPDVIAAGSARGVTRDMNVRVELQQLDGRRWETRASGRLRSADFTVVWRHFHGGTARFRVAIAHGRSVLAVSQTKTVPNRGKASTAVQTTLRPSTATAPASNVISVASLPDGTQTVVLAAGAHVPKKGTIFVANASAREPGALGTVISAKAHANGRVWLVLRKSSLEAAYSSFSIEVDGTLGSLASQRSVTGHEQARVNDSGNVGLDALDDVQFSCMNPATQLTVTHSINLSSVEVRVVVEAPSISDPFTKPYILFDIHGQPKFDFGVTFTGKESCTADTTIAIPIADTPLEIEIGPDFTLSASGAVGVNFSWSPFVAFGFARGIGTPSENWTAFTNEGSTTFSGQAKVSLALMLDVGLSLAGHVGIQGSLGPDITGTVSASSATNQACLTVDGQFDADLSAYAKVFFDNFSFTIGSFTWPKSPFPLYHGCSGGGGSGGGSSGGSGGTSVPGTLSIVARYPGPGRIADSGAGNQQHVGPSVRSGR